MTTKTKDLRSKDIGALKDEIKALQKTHFNLRIQKATQQLQDTTQLRQTRRAIAQAKTILFEHLTKERVS
jgi:large subunit ribosomal protein L29